MTDEIDTTCGETGLCAELSGSDRSDFTRTYSGTPASRILNENTNFAIVSDISPLVEGHLLVTPKKHYFNFASAIEQHRDEAVATLKETVRWVSDTYGEVAIFEHGSAPDGGSGACIHHAHVHVLPVSPLGLLNVMQADNLQVKMLDGITAWQDIAETRRAYLLCSDSESIWVAYPSTSPRHQYLRAAVAYMLGVPDPEWDWSLVIRKDLLRATVDRYRTTA